MPAGQFCRQRDFAYKKITSIPGISCVKPDGALYLFPKLDARKYTIKDDQQFILDLLLQERVLVVQGTGFNWPKPDHFRVVFLPGIDELEMVMEKIGHFFSTYSQ